MQRSSHGGSRPSSSAGKALGRPMVGAAVEAKVKRLRRQGLGMIKIATELRIGVATVQRIVNAA